MKYDAFIDEVQKQAIPKGEVRQILESLPDEFGQVFGDGQPYKRRPRP